MTSSRPPSARPGPGPRLGYEAAGVVEAVGEGVTELAAGDPVMTGPGIEMSAQGVYGDRIVLPATAVVPRPASTDPVTGAATWLAYTTAYGGMPETGGLRPGDHALITAASSGVGIAALQTAARVGAVPVAVTRTAARRDALLKAGAAHVIVSEEQDVAEEARRLTGGSGVELIFDAVGGPEPAALARSAASPGTVVLYGRLSREPPAPGRAPAAGVQRPHGQDRGHGRPLTRRPAARIAVNV